MDFPSLFYPWILFGLSDCSSVVLSFSLHVLTAGCQCQLGKDLGYFPKYCFFSLVTKGSNCCDLRHFHSLNSVELPHFTPARDGAGYY